MLPALVLDGTLEEHPLPLLIALILDAQLSGLLRFESEETKYWIYFDEGFPAGAYHPKAQDYLGSVLRELNFIDDAAFNESLMRMAQEKRLQGQILLDMEVVDDNKLERGLSLQLARKLSKLFVIKTGTFEFIEDEELPPPGEPIRVNPYALIYNAIRSHYQADDLKKGLAGMIGKAVKASRLFVERGPLFDFPEEDLADSRLLEEFRLPQEFVRGSRSGPTAAMMMLLALLYCDMLEFEEAEFAQPIRGRGQKPAPKPAAAKPVTERQGRPGAGQAATKSDAKPISESLRNKINEKFEQIKTAEPWEVLEVEKDADSTRLKKAFYTLAKVYHPDRVVSCDDEELLHRLDVIISKINEGFQILSDPHARMAYMAQKKGQKEGPKSSGPRPEEAKIQFQKAMFFYKKKEMVKAAECLRWAVEMDPAEQDFLAWRIWVDYERGEGPPDDLIQTAKGDLLALSKSDPDCFFAARFLSRLYYQLNDTANYERFLIRANKIKPKDVEVSRELRLHRARKEKADAKGKFLGIRFKKTDD